MSRMDRYNTQDETQKSRSSKNQELYNSIYKLGEYSNIEGIATIDKSNEVDITKVKKMLQNREEYQKQKEIRNISKKEETVPTYDVYEPDDDKVYDIRDILDKAKINKPEKETHKSLKDLDFEILKELKEKNKKRIEEEQNEEMSENFVDTLNELSDQELGLNMLGDLKSENNTIIQDKESIRKLLEEAKKLDEEKEKELEKSNTLDKSFFSSSLRFNRKDFEELQAIQKNEKTRKKIFIILGCVLGFLLVCGAIFFVYCLIK